MRKKSTTKKPTAKEQRAQLSRDLAAVLANPATPLLIYTNLSLAVNEVYNHLPSSRKIDHSESYLLMVLEAEAERGAH
jgi:hypothetical protein